MLVALVTMGLMAPGGAVSPMPYERYHCAHSHTRKQALRGIAVNMRSAKRLTKRRGRYIRHFVKCTKTRKSFRVTRRSLRRYRKWRKSYQGYWFIQRKRTVTGSEAGFLVSLRSCESGGRYAYNGSSGYDGAYQYDGRTWGEAQSVYGAPDRFRTALAWQASAAHQDTVTSTFYPGNASRWPNCP